MRTGKILTRLDTLVRRAVNYRSAALDRLAARAFPSATQLHRPRLAPTLVIGPNSYMSGSDDWDKAGFFTLSGLQGSGRKVQVGKQVTAANGTYTVLRKPSEGKEATQGGMSEIYFVRCDELTEAGLKENKRELLGKEFVLKEFVDYPGLSVAARHTLFIRFLKEMNTMDTISGRSNTVQIVDYEPGVDSTFFIMRKVAGTDLDVYLEEGNRLSPRQACLVLIKVLEGLINFEKAIAKGKDDKLAHRDLKPANIFIVFDQDGKINDAVLLDFGIAKVPESEQTRLAGIELMGSPGYIDPKTIPPNGCAWQADQRSDIWSLGAILYLLLTGKPVYQIGSEEQLRSYLTLFGGNPSPYLMGLFLKRPKELDGPAFKDLWNYTFRALAFDPAKRFPSYEALKYHLQDAMDQLPEEK